MQALLAHLNSTFNSVFFSSPFALKPLQSLVSLHTNNSQLCCGKIAFIARHTHHFFPFSFSSFSYGKRKQRKKTQESFEAAEFVMDLLPVFFKIYFTNESSELMKIPEEFVGNLKAEDEGSRQAYLVGPGGEEWRVGFARRGNDCFFTDGWKTFVKDNGVAFAHFLLFRYHGGMRFNVNIFMPSGLESGAAFTARCSQGWKNNGAEKGQSSNNGGQVRPAFCLVKPLADEGASRRSGKRSKGQSHVMSAAEQRVADVFSSVRPFIVRQMNFERNRTPVLHVPKSFFSENSVICKPFDRHLVLRTQHGGCWSLTINHGTYVHTLCGGWASFLRDNNIENGDVCVFEIADSSELELLVHIFHAPF